MNTAPGYYEAEGDPPGTVRYWDGSRWTSDPMPAPPGFDPDHDARMAGVWVRIGATLLDGLVSLIITAPFLIPWFSDLIDQIDAGVPAEEIDSAVPTSFLIAGLGVTVVYVLMVAFLGGTPGKLMLGLRITTEDGVTTPPGLRRGVLRSVPQFASAVPVIGPLISIAFVVLSVVWINTTYERTSAYDRIAGTRVVRKVSLPAP